LRDRVIVELAKRELDLMQPAEDYNSVLFQILIWFRSPFRGCRMAGEIDIRLPKLLPIGVIILDKVTTLYD
jgi:hypothetical protein